MKPADVQHPTSRFVTDRGLSVRWLGTAGFELIAPDGTTLLIDPYLTRVGLWDYLTKPIAPSVEKINAGIGRADAILVGHSHFDHVMDVPVIARQSGARVIGSVSTANLMQAQSLPAHQIVQLDKHRRTTLEVGPFRITAIPSLHSPFALGKKVPYAGAIPSTCDIHLRGSGYRCGDVFSFLIEVDGFRMYHLGSANLAEDQIPVEARDVDLLLMCIAARPATPKFVTRALAATTPRTVLPMHYDFMWRSADKPMRLLPRTDFGRLVDEVQGFSRGMSVLTLPLTARRPTPHDHPATPSPAR